MKDIKTKPAERTFRVLAQAVKSPKKLAKNSAIQIKAQAQEIAEYSPLAHEAPEQYATNRVEQSGERTVHHAGQDISDRGKQLIKKQRKNLQLNREAKRGTDYRSSSSFDINAFNTGKNRVQHTNQQARQANQSAKQTVKKVKKTIKTTERTAKTTQRTMKASEKAVKTSTQAAKIAAKTAQASVMTAPRAAHAARTAAKTAVRVVKDTVKAIAAAIKALIAFIAAGGWVVTVIILIAAIIALIIGSVFGIFFSNDATEGMLMSQAITQINSEFRTDIDTQIESIKASEVFDEVHIVYDGDIDGDSDTVNNWADVLSIYAVKTMYDGQEVLTITPEKIGLLRDTFNEMNEFCICSETTTEEVANNNEDGEEETTTVTTLTIYITVSSLTYEEAATLHSFDEEQTDMLEELMSPDYYTYFAGLLGVDVYGGMTSEDLTNIILNLPAGTKGAAIVEAAVTRLGHPYSKAKRGSGDYVDCSYLAWWAYDQAGVSIPSTSVMQAKFCYENGYVIGQSELQPGDLVFWSKTTCHCGRWHEIHHVAIYIGDNKIIEASSSRGRVILNELWGLGNGKWQIYMYTRPHD